MKSLCPVGADNQRNLCASAEDHNGDVEAVLAECDEVVEHTYHVQRSPADDDGDVPDILLYGYLRTAECAELDPDRLPCAPHSVQCTRHSEIEDPCFQAENRRRIQRSRRWLPKFIPAFVTWKTGKPSKMIFTREESQTASTPRHEMEVTIRLGAMKDGRIRAIDLYTLSNTGAYGAHGPTTVGLSGQNRFRCMDLLRLTGLRMMLCIPT